jgi:hypothetical protein
MSARRQLIPAGELRRSPLSLIDEAGTVFFWRGRVLRAVPASAAPQVRALLGSGLVEALAERRWAPRCAIAELEIAGYEFVLEQERIPIVSYPYEWSYGMLRDAGMRVLEIAQLAHAHGWELKDTHGFNLLFDGVEPQWVDLGSFVPRPAGAKDWPPLEDFVRFYEYPLRLWGDGGSFLGRRLVAVSDLMSHADYALYRWSVLRRVGIGSYQAWVRRWYQLGRIGRLSPAEVRARAPGLLGRLAWACRTRGWLPGGAAGLERRRQRLARRARRVVPSLWGDYQMSGAASVATPRFGRIADLLRRMAVTSVVELGGNQGWLGERLLREGVVQSALCTDADELAVDRGYERTKAGGGRLHTAVLDFVFPMVNPGGGEAPAVRFRADAVLALAVSHHLLLTQRIPVDHVFTLLQDYARRLVFIEFMPLGLWDGKTAPPVPEWYTLAWFREAFGRHFELRHEERLEENRHLFCGACRTGPAAT